jgi:hypothetical protein
MRSRSRRQKRPLLLPAYYDSADVRHAMLEYRGVTGTDPSTAVYLCGLCPGDAAMPSWDHHAVRVAPAKLDVLCAAGCDIARSLWDRTHLIFLIELDYENIDEPAEPYLRPAETFFKVEPVYRAARRVFAGLGLDVQTIMTGRGYQFRGRIELEDPLIARLAAMAPDTPGWHADVPSRLPPDVHAAMSAEHARAAAGLGMLLEFAAHLISRASAAAARIPVVFNGTIVGSGTVGRECVSIDFSHAGDPLDVRHFRAAFSAYQWHLMRPDIFGPLAKRHVPPLVALPREHQSLAAMLTRGRTLRVGRSAARRTSVRMPDLSRGVARLLEAYQASPLAAYHAEFYATLSAAPRDVNLQAVPPCMRATLTQPNDLLLKPEHLQHLVRGLMARDWTPSDIARLVQQKYEEDHAWGDRWTWMHARTRAEFEVRVFSGMIRTGLDTLIDFNCVSAQEKDLCPGSSCAYDLRRDRERLIDQTLS